MAAKKPIKMNCTGCQVEIETWLPYEATYCRECYADIVAPTKKAAAGESLIGSLAQKVADWVLGNFSYLKKRD